MKNEPQLSEEMEKRFDEEFGKEAQSGSMLDLYDFYEGGVYLDIKHFLATELERQREEYVEAVKNRKATIKWLWGKQKTENECFLMVMEQVQKIKDDVEKARE